jgi:hypothetical protein
MRSTARLATLVVLLLLPGSRADAAPTAPTASPAPVSVTRQSDLESHPLAIRRTAPLDASSMTPEETLWYGRLLAGLDASRVWADNTMLTGDSYAIGRDGGNYIEALLMALRATGERRFLDRVLELTELARLGLRDAWLDGTTDGYTDWLWLVDPGNATYYGRDTNWLDESMASGNAALWMWAFHINRDVDPAYAAAADFWLGWLENHFLAKWYSRVGGDPLVAWNTPFAAFYKPDTEPRSANWRLAYYLFQVTGDSFYRDRANQILNQLTAVQQLNPSYPQAYRWARQLDPSTGEWQLINYANYYVRVVLEMHLEQVPFFSDPVVMARFAATFRDVVFATSNPSLTTMKADVNGGGSVTYALYAFNGLSAWDPSGFLMDLAHRSIVGAGNYAGGGLSKAARNDAYISSYALMALNPSGSPTSTLVAALNAMPQTDGRVRIEWLISSPDAGVRTNLDRVSGAGATRVNTSPAIGAGMHVAMDTPPEGEGTLAYELKLETEDGEVTIGRIEVQREAAALAFTLDQNEPNPFEATTVIRFGVVTPARVRLSVYDAGGRLVRTLQDLELSPGSYSALWDGTDKNGAPVRNGVYFVVASAGSQRMVRRAVRIE